VCLHICEGEIAISKRLTTNFSLSPLKNGAEKNNASRRAKKVFTPTRANPRISEETEEGASDDDEEFNLPLNQKGLNPTFDKTIPSIPLGIGKGAALTSPIHSDAYALGTTTHNYLLEQQADQREQLRQLCSLVSTLGDKIRTVVKTVGNYPGNSSAD